MKRLQFYNIIHFYFSISIVILLCFFAATTANGQTSSCDCKSDLLYLNSKIKKLTSYKRNKASYDEVFKNALYAVTNQETYYDCFITLNRLLTPLKDHHMGVLLNTSDSLSISKIAFPVYKGNLEDLNFKLERTTHKDIEGIYHHTENFSIGMVYDESQDIYNAVVIKSLFKNWKPGDIIYKITPLEHGVYKVMGGQFPSNRLISYHEKIDKGMFLRAGFRKDTSVTYHHKNPYPDQNLVFKGLNAKTDYLKIGSFKTRYPYLKEAEDFYAKIQGKLNKPNLILDLRDNGGGGDRNSDILFKQLKKYLKNNSIFILINASTGSNAEQFSIKLKEYDNVLTFGDRTRGALAYEIKPDDYYTLPSSKFLVILPSKLHKKYLPYETKGINPDHALDYQSSWLEQLDEFINHKN